LVVADPKSLSAILGRASLSLDGDSRIGQLISLSAGTKLDQQSGHPPNAEWRQARR